MQTFLYVLGPFLLQAGFGLAAIIVALGFVFKVLIPKARLLNQQHDEIDTAYAYATEAHEFVCDLVVELDRNTILEDALPSRFFNKAQALNRPVLRKKELA